jgi:hypothetical protein
MKQKQILVEFHNWSINHSCFNFVLAALKKKKDLNINAYATFPFFFSSSRISYFFNLIKFFIGNFLSLNTFGTYKSMGVKKNLMPFIKKKHKEKAELYFNNFYKKSTITKSHICDFKINDYYIGDVLYDSYLRSENLRTLHPGTLHFKDFLKNFLSLFFFWEEYFELNKIEAVVAVHTTYLPGIPLRIAALKNIKSIVVEVDKIWQLNKDNLSTHKENIIYNKIFKKINNKRKLLIKSNQLMKKRLSGDLERPIIFSGTSSGENNSFKKFEEKINNRVLIKSKKFKVLIAPHAFADAPHARGNMLFADYYEWLISLMNLSKKTNYEWYIKLHPYYLEYFDDTYDVVKNLISKKYNNINWIDPKISNKQLIEEGINIVLTVHGSVGSEFPFFNVPVVNASLNNPHVHYNFNINPVDLEDYYKIIKRLHLIKKDKIKRKELLEYFYMHNLYFDKSWILDEPEKFINKFANNMNIYKNKSIFKYLNSELPNHRKKTIDLILRNFFNTKNYCLLLRNSNIVKVNL